MEEALSSTGSGFSFFTVNFEFSTFDFQLRTVPSNRNRDFFFYFELSTVDCETSSVLTFEDEIRECGEGARKFRIWAAIETRLGAARIVLCERAGAVERAGFMNQRNDGFGTHGIKFLFFQHARDQFARIAVAIFHRVDQRQRDFALFQVAEDRFAKLLR